MAGCMILWLHSVAMANQIQGDVPYFDVSSLSIAWTMYFPCFDELFSFSEDKTAETIKTEDTEDQNI